MSEGGVKQAVKSALRVLAAPVRRLRRKRAARLEQAEAGVRRKEYPNDRILAQVRSLIEEGHTATICVKGYSMRPFLEHCRDKVTLASCQTLQVGDAVLAEVLPGCFVLHRIIRIDGDRLTLMGDGNLYGTEQCMRRDVAGIVTHYIRCGHTVPASSRRLRLGIRVWCILLPVRRYLLFIYRLFV